MTIALTDSSLKLGAVPKINAAMRKALLSRLVEERLLALFSEGALFGTVHTCIGQEFSGAAITESLRPGDTIFSNHRCHGHYLSWTDDVEGLIAELMGRATGVCGGKSGSQHLCKDGFYSNGIQGGIVPVAAGLALAHQQRAAGNISVVFIGDGTLGEGAVYEALNVAAKWRLPLLVVVEDNGFAQSTNRDETLAGSIVARAAAFGIRHAEADTWDWEALQRTAAGLVSQVRADGGPALLHVRTFRLKAHSKGDDTRPRADIEPFEKRDPLNVILARGEPALVELRDSLQARIERAVETARVAPSCHLDLARSAATSLAWSEAALPRGRFVQALNAAFQRIMEAEPAAWFIGEDVLSPYGGAFKASQSLSDRFPARVRNTPISEACIVGLGTGLALAGQRPMIEIMFGDFLGLAFDQIVNHAAKFGEMYNGQVSVDLVVRTPMGGGRGYGPTHSQTLDRHFLGVPGLRVLALNHLIDPGAIYGTLFAGRRGPTLVIENKLMYGAHFRASLPEGFKLLHSNETFPTAWLKPDATAVDCTLLGYGGTVDLMVAAADRLFLEHDVIAQVICPTQIDPFSVEPLLPLLERSDRCVIVEEGQGFAAFGAEVLAQLAELAPATFARCRRLNPARHCIPASGPAERALLPSVETIMAAVLELKR